ncbi:MAG: lysophospholipid acyltransferase family protein [Sediminibacterium sp.]|jgi:1-acyl-sn-glycerol-3-phosphate acyltransferase
MKWLLKGLQAAYSIYALCMFIIVMLLVFPFILCCLPFGKIKGGNLIYNLCRIWGLTWYYTIGVQHREVYEAPHDRARQYIFIANHISYMDIPPIILATHQPIRALGKVEMVKIPVFGWIYRAAVILVDRTNTQARAKSVRALKAAIKKNISIIIFPEGTFNETKKPLKSFFDGAFRIAVESQTPIKPLLLVDTLKRLHYKSVFSLTPGISRVVYLEEIPVNNLTQKDIPALKEKVYKIMEEGLRRYVQYPTP